MIRHGKTSTGRQRWRCKPCQITTLNEIDSTAKHLDEFLTWLLGRRRQVDLPGGGRSFRRRCEPLWQLWPFSPIVDEVHDVIFVDGIHLGRNAVVLIAQTPDCVLGWYAARSENSRAWGALMRPLCRHLETYPLEVQLSSHTVFQVKYNYARFTDLTKNPELIAANRNPVENI